MRVAHVPDQDPPTLAVTGAVGPAQVKDLQASILEAVVAGSDSDLVLDMRAVTTFDDTALHALTVGRSRAKFLGHKIVVLDETRGAVTTSLRRSGLIFRFPVYADGPAANAGLAQARAALEKRTVREGAGRADSSSSG